MLFTAMTLNEMRRIWMQPLVWIVLGFTFIILALLFLVLLNNFYAEIQVKFAGLPNAPGVTDSVFSPMFFWSAIIGALMMPLFTMRIITEEKVRHQFTLLSSAPVSCRLITSSKMLALISVIAVFAILNLLFPLTILAFVDLDWGKISAAVFGVILFQTSFTAISLWLAACTQNLIFSVLSSFTVLFLLFVLFISGASTEDSNLFSYLSSFSHLLPSLSGLVTSQDIIYFVVVTVLFLGLTVIRLRFKRE